MADNAPIREPMIDLKTGLLTPVWQKYYSQVTNPAIKEVDTLRDEVDDHETRINALENP